MTGLTDTAGNVVKSYQYDAFGNEKNIDANDTNPFRYSSEYFDKETGTIYLRARYYNPSTGRFISEDSYWTRRSGIYEEDNPVMLVGNIEGKDIVEATTEEIFKKQEVTKSDLPWIMKYNGKDSASMIVQEQEKALGQGNKKDKAKLEEAIKNAKLLSIGAILQSSNLYLYCINNPIMYTDPSGQEMYFKMDYTKTPYKSSSYIEESSTAQDLLDALSSSGVTFSNSCKTGSNIDYAIQGAAFVNALLCNAGVSLLANTKGAMPGDTVVQNYYSDRIEYIVYDQNTGEERNRFTTANFDNDIP